MDYRYLNPTTEEMVKAYPFASGTRIEEVLTCAQNEFSLFRKSQYQKRSELLSSVAAILEARVQRLSTLIASEMGKPITQARAEVLKCAACARHFSANGERYLRSKRIPLEGQESQVCYEPIGPVFAIMPWNFPFWQVFRFALPAIAAGNVIVLKHAPNTPGCALVIEEIFGNAGFAPGVFQSLFLNHEQAERVIADPRIAGVTLTGSTRAGKQVAALSGKAIKKTVLELGGNDPFIVFDDVDMELVAKQAALARLQNAGQSCIAAKRILVQRRVLDDFLSAFTGEMAAQVLGDPLLEQTTIGPLARSDLRETLTGQVTSCIEQGLKLLLGGTQPPGKGYFYLPTVLLAEDVAEASLDDQELFGPVATVIPFQDQTDAIRIANHTQYGLGASIWTKDLERARSVAAEIEAGAVFINSIVKSDSRLPFGGVKASGYGRELGEPGILEFVNIKTVVVAT